MKNVWRVSKLSSSPLAGEDIKPWAHSDLGKVGEGFLRSSPRTQLRLGNDIAKSAQPSPARGEGTEMKRYWSNEDVIVRSPQQLQAL